MFKYSHRQSECRGKAAGLATAKDSHGRSGVDAIKAMPKDKAKSKGKNLHSFEDTEEKQPEEEIGGLDLCALSLVQQWYKRNEMHRATIRQTRFMQAYSKCCDGEQCAKSLVLDENGEPEVESEQEAADLNPSAKQESNYRCKVKATIDSVAAVSVFPSEWFTDYPIMVSA